MKGAKNTMGRSRLIYFAPGDLVFVSRPRECHCRLTAAKLTACVCTCTYARCASLNGRGEGSLSGTADLS
jgi:hypothetical protein